MHFLKKLVLISVIFASLSLLSWDVCAQENDHELFQVSQKAFEDGFYDVAIRYIEQLLSKFPTTDKRIEANLLLGQCYFFKNQYLKAYETFQGLLQYSEYKDVTLFWLGETYLKGTDYAQAEKYYRQLIDSFPNSSYTPQGYYSLGWLYLDQNKPDKAEDTFAQLVVKFPDHQLAEDASFKIAETEYNAHHYDKAIEYFKAFILKYEHSNKHAESYFYIGESYYYQQDFLTALTYYAKAADIAYDNKLTLMSKVSLGWCYLKLGKYELSAQNFDQALKLATEKGLLSDDVYLGQANLYTETKEFQKALQAYQTLVDNFPTSSRLPECLLGKANAYYALGDYDNAVKTYRTIVNKYGDDKNQKQILEKTYFGLAWSYLKAGSVDLALDTFKTIKDQTENKTVKISALTQIGDAYQDINQFDKALEIYDQILRDYPDSPYTDYVQYRQGVALLKMEKNDQAILSFQSLVANFPKSTYLTDIKYYLAVAYFKKGDWAQAKDHVQEFLKLEKPSPEFLADANYILALCYFNLNQFDRAIAGFDSVMKNFPEQTAIIRSSEVSIAKCLYKRGDVAEALKRFKLIIEKYARLEPAQEAIVWLGDYYLENTQYDLAINYYQQYLNQFPSGEKKNIVYYELGQAYVMQQNYEKAVSAFKQIHDPKNQEINTKAKLAIADIFSRELKPEETITTYMSIINSAPEFKRDAYNKIAQVYKQNKDYEKAVDSFREALKADQGLSQIKAVELQFNLADTLELAQRFKEASDEYLKIPYLYAKETYWIVKAYLRIGRIFEDQEQWEEAKTIYKKIVDYKTEEGKFAQERIDWINSSFKK